HGGVHRVRVDREVRVALDADGVAAGGVGGKGGLEGVNELGAARLGRAGVLGDEGVVVRGRTGHDQVQEVHFGDVERVAVLSLDGKSHAGTLTGFGVVHRGDGEHDAGQLGGAGGHWVRWLSSTWGRLT